MNMERIQMEKEYRLSRIIIAVLTMIISFIMFINEHISVKIVAMGLFTSAAFLSSFLGTKVSQKMIQIGDKIATILLRVLYYIALLIALLNVACILLMIFNFITDIIPYSNEIGIAAGQAMLTVLIGSSFLVFAIIPYIQTLIVLGLRKIMSNRQ